MKRSLEWWASLAPNQMRKISHKLIHLECVDCGFEVGVHGKQGAAYDPIQMANRYGRVDSAWRWHCEGCERRARSAQAEMEV